MSKFHAIKTEGIKYTGSKKRLIPSILEIVADLKDVQSVLDGFSGTTRVSQAFSQMGYNTSSNDIAIWSEVFGNAYLIAKKPDPFYKEIIDYLNNLEGKSGWFSEYYGAESAESKRPFQLKNSQKLDAIREEIDNLNLAWEDKCVILTSLILALDKVDSTIGHFAAYLSKWSSRSFKDLRLELPRRFALKSKNQVIRDDIFNTISNHRFDLAYFDPPYGSNNEKMPSSRVRYSAYYHFWTSVILNDQPDLFGVANRREDSRDFVSSSVFEEFRKNEDDHFIAMKAIETLIQKTNADYILLSYSSGGRATKQELHDILNNSGKLLKTLEIDYKKNVMAQMTWSNKWVGTDNRLKEYLFLLKKS